MAAVRLAGRFLCVVLLAWGALPAEAGDEVDYSAPYLVVEDGKLVTKYPGKEHDPAAGAGTDAAAAGEPGPEPEAGRPATWVAGAAGLVVLAGALIAWRRRRG